MTNRFEPQQSLLSSKQPLNLLLGSQSTVLSRIAQLDLERGVFNPEMVVQLFANLSEERITRMTYWHN